MRKNKQPQKFVHHHHEKYGQGEEEIERSILTSTRAQDYGELESILGLAIRARD